MTHSRVTGQHSHLEECIDRFTCSELMSTSNAAATVITHDDSGVATIEATEAAASVKIAQQFRLSSLNIQWHP